MSVNSSTFNIYVSISRAMLQNVANFWSTINAAPMCQVNVCLQNNKSEQCSHVRCYFHSVGWHPLFSPMILFFVYELRIWFNARHFMNFPQKRDRTIRYKGCNTIIRLIKFCYNKSNKRNCNVYFEICLKILIFHWQQINKNLSS